MNAGEETTSLGEFAKLESQLTIRDWGLADEETRRILCLLSRREAAQHLIPEDLALIDDGDFRRVDDLWQSYSNGLYGLGVAARIWLECGGPAEILTFEQLSRDEKSALGTIEKTYNDRVGRREGAYVMRLDPRCPGHYPSQCLCCSYGYGLYGLVLSAVCWKLGLKHTAKVLPKPS